MRGEDNQNLAFSLWGTLEPSGVPIFFYTIIPFNWYPGIDEWIALALRRMIKKREVTLVRG